MSTFNNKTPIYLQVMDDIKKKILSGTILPGEKLASVRDIALEQGINPNTAQKALTQLEAEGLIVTNRTSGRSVTENEELIKSLHENFVRDVVINFVIKMTAIGYNNSGILSYVEKIQKERAANE